MYRFRYILEYVIKTPQRTLENSLLKNFDEFSLVIRVAYDNCKL